MKKSELRKIIKEVIQEASSIKLIPKHMYRLKQIDLDWDVGLCRYVGHFTKKGSYYKFTNFKTGKSFNIHDSHLKNYKIVAVGKR